VHDAERHLAERGALIGGNHGDRDAAGLESGCRGTGPVDRVDDEDRARGAETHQAPILGVEGDVSLGGELLLDDGLGHLVDRERGVTAGRVADLDPRRPPRWGATASWTLTASPARRMH
jgi:hypothetical protein